MSENISNCRWVIATQKIHPGSGQGYPSYALARRLIDRGAEVHLIANRIAEDLEQERSAVVYPIPRPQVKGSTVWIDLMLERTVKRLLRRLKLDPALTPIVAMGGNSALGTLNWVHYVHHAWRPSTKLSLLSPGRLAHSALNRYERFRERRALASPPILIANSKRTRVDLIEGLGVPQERVHVIYYGTEKSFLHPVTPADREQARRVLNLPGSARVVAFVGALGLDGRKGFDLLLKSWKLRSERLGEFPGYLLAVGSGALDYWKRLTLDAGLEGCVKFLGYRSDVSTILGASDLLVSPTRYEAYGLNVHEAICRRIPALVSKSAGVAERYPAELRSWLIDDIEDVTSLEWTIGVTLDEGPSVEQRDVLKRFAEQLGSRTWDDMADDIIQLWYDEVRGIDNS